MGVDDKQLLQSIARMVDVMPDEARKYIMGYAEGVISMSKVVLELKDQLAAQRGA